jgi:hypothetical protein
MHLTLIPSKRMTIAQQVSRVGLFREANFRLPELPLLTRHPSFVHRSDAPDSNPIDIAEDKPLNTRSSGSASDIAGQLGTLFWWMRCMM